MVEGNNMYMDSTRAEARGLLATMLRLLASIKRYPNVQTIDHATDNEAVVDIYAGMKPNSCGVASCNRYGYMARNTTG